jgi:pimeloyl-ACP methyl ester carboxylesterase
MVPQRETEATTTDPGRLTARLIEGLPITERGLDLAGFSTPVLEGGEGPPIVLLHGQGGFKEVWGGDIRRLVATNRVVAPDLPGLGRSEVRGGTLDAPGVVAWLDELIAKTCDQPPTLVGASLGGSIAARYVIEHPDRIDRVVLVDSGSLGPFRPSPRLMIALLRFIKRPSIETHEAFARRMFGDLERIRAGWGDRWKMLQAYQIDRASQPSVGAANRQLLRRIGMRRIPPDRLRKISVPVALIWGRNDRVMRFRIAEKASARFGWPLYPIDAGHLPMAEQPDAFLEALHAAMGTGP